MKSNFYSSFTANRSTAIDRNKILLVAAWAILFLLALYLRTSGLFRGLGDQGAIFHPDEAKQVLALFNFLNGDYLRYYGSLFYDGYPYGLNHLDEYLLRPLLFFFGPDTPDHFSLYYYARLLRVAYGMAVLAIAGTIVYKLTENRIAAMLAMFLLAIAPVSITVTHFATGDVGVDLFTGLCFLFLLFYLAKNHPKTWLFACGVAVGAAFSAKYNGLLVGMVPAMILCFEFLQDKQILRLARRCVILLSGTITGTVIFTPHLLLDPGTSVTNIVANFEFIKNYSVPADILARPWLERAILGLKNNTLYIISSLGYTLCLAAVLCFLVAGKKFLACLRSAETHECSHNRLILSMAIFPILSLFIALCGKYAVQPFHFSSLQLPLVVVTCTLFSVLFTSRFFLLKICGLIIIAMSILEFGPVSWKENFFWRLEDNAYFEQNLPASIYDREAFYTHRSGPIRSLYLEPPGNSVFRNHNKPAKGPDAFFWNSIEVAPLPQVANPIGKNWIFLNGPTFPRNEKMIPIHGEGHGKTIKRYLVLPDGKDFPSLGIRSGAYATKAAIDFGSTTALITLDAHQQKVVPLVPKKWKVSGGRTTGEEEVRIIPLEISVPHNDVWLTILSTRKEQELFTLFGGGQDTAPSVPDKIPAELEEQYFDALSRVRYLEASPSWRILAGKEIPMWEIALPAGRFKLICEIEGLADESAIAIEIEDAGRGLYRQQKQSFKVKKGIQRIEYAFTKPFVPYQARLVVSGLNGTSHMHRFKLFPDYQRLSDDLETWRQTGKQPEWVARFGK